MPLGIGRGPAGFCPVLRLSAPTTGLPFIVAMIAGVLPLTACSQGRDKASRLLRQRVRQIFSAQRMARPTTVRLRTPAAQ